MDRKQLNLYLDGLLALSEAPEQDRALLIEEARDSNDLADLLSDWLWLQEKDYKAALEVKTWFQLDYKALGRIFDMSPREMAQILRNLRAQLLPPPLQEENQSAHEVSQLSCFMVEQHLSAWIDGEILDPRSLESLHSHLALCSNCYERLEAYRHLHHSLLKNRPRRTFVSEEEWHLALDDVRVRKRRQFLRFLLYVSATLGVAIILAWAIWSKPEKMPNIYEVHEK